ncbi:hypothetical protein ACVGWT_00620, partial [Enterobacter hormaechei]
MKIFFGWFFFFLNIYKKQGKLCGFFSFCPLWMGERAGVSPPDRTTLPAFTPGGAALTGPTCSGTLFS